MTIPQSTMTIPQSTMNGLQGLRMRYPSISSLGPEQPAGVRAADAEGAGASKPCSVAACSERAADGHLFCPMHEASRKNALMSDSQAWRASDAREGTHSFDPLTF